MRWTLAGLGFALETLALTLYFLSAAERLAPESPWRGRVRPLFICGATALGLFAFIDRDPTLLLSQIMACLLFILLARPRKSS